jgi:hypothetical protein
VLQLWRQPVVINGKRRRRLLQSERKGRAAERTAPARAQSCSSQDISEQEKLGTGTVRVEGLLYKLTVLNFQSYLVTTISSYLHLPRHAGSCRPGWNCFSCAVQSVCKRRADAARHVELALNAEDTALVATSRSLSLIVNYLEAFLCRLEHWLRDWKISINVSKSTAMLFTTRCIQRPRTIQFLGESTAWVETARYLGVTLDNRLTWSAHISQVGRKAPQILDVIGPLLNTKSGLSIGRGVLLYKQLIRPVMDYGCPVWRSAAHSHVRKLQVLHSKCLRIATGAAWYVSNRQIHEDLGIPFFADHIRALTESFDSKLSDAGNPLVRQLERHLRLPSAVWRFSRSTE